MVQSGEPPPPAILYMDPPEHGRLRGLVNKAFTPRAVAAQRDTVIEQVQQCLSKADPRRFDVEQDFSAIFPGEVITSMVGVPEDYRAQFREFVEVALRYQPGQSAPSETTVTMMLNAAAYCYSLVQERRAQPADDMISTLIAAEIERDNGEKASLGDATTSRCSRCWSAVRAPRPSPNLSPTPWRPLSAIPTSGASCWKTAPRSLQRSRR